MQKNKFIKKIMLFIVIIVNLFLITNVVWGTDPADAEDPSLPELTPEPIRKDVMERINETSRQFYGEGRKY